VPATQVARKECCTTELVEGLDEMQFPFTTELVEGLDEMQSPFTTELVEGLDEMQFPFTLSLSKGSLSWFAMASTLRQAQGIRRIPAQDERRGPFDKLRVSGEFFAHLNSNGILVFWTSLRTKNQEQQRSRPHLSLRRSASD
jgi:hypothetical protein